MILRGLRCRNNIDLSIASEDHVEEDENGQNHPIFSQFKFQPANLFLSPDVIRFLDLRE